MAGLGDMFGQSFATVNGQKPRNSDRIQEGQPLNLRGAFEAAQNIPVAGDVLSGVMAAYDAAKGDYPSAAMNAVGMLPFVSGTFIGKGAKTWDAIKAADAEMRIAAGDDVRKVWKETGYGIAPDGQMKFEIDDSAAVFEKSHPASYMPEMSPLGKARSAEEAETMGKEYNSMLRNVQMFKSADGKIGNAFLHSDLYNAIPGTDQLRLEFKNLGSAYGASYGDGLIEMGLGNLGNARQAKDGLIHELQHHVQDVSQGFARGGSPEEMQKMLATNPSYGKDAKEAYKRLYGEAEARLASNRMSMSKDERLNKYPWDEMSFYAATGTPIEELIFKYK